MPAGVMKDLSERRARWAAAFVRLPPNLQGAGWLLLSAVLFTFSAVLIKRLGAELDGFQVALFRAAAGLMFTLPFLVRAGIGSLKTRQPLLQMVRAVAAAIAIGANFYAVIHLPLANATALSFSRSLFLAPLAIIFLSERVGWRRTAATLAGFLGVLIVLRPTVSVDVAALAALLAALCVAIAAICVNILSRTDRPATLLFYSGVVSTLLLFVPAALAWRMPTPEQWFWLIAMGGIAVAAQGCFIRAFAIGEATSLAPIDYTRLLFASIAGFFFFANLPDVWTLSGSAVIIGSTLYITRREAKLGKVDIPPPPIAVAETGLPPQKPEDQTDNK